MADDRKEKQSLEWLRQHTDLGPIKNSNQQTQKDYQALGKTLSQTIGLLPKEQQDSAQKELSEAYGAVKSVLLAKNAEEHGEFEEKLDALKAIVTDQQRLIEETLANKQDHIEAHDKKAQTLRAEIAAHSGDDGNNEKAESLKKQLARVSEQKKVLALEFAEAAKRSNASNEERQRLLTSLRESVSNNIAANQQLADIEQPEPVTIKSIGDRRNMSAEDLKKIIYSHDVKDSIIGGNITPSVNAQGESDGKGYVVTGSNPADIQKVVERLHQSGATKISVTSKKPNKQMIEAACHAARLGITAVLTSPGATPSPEMQAWNKIFSLIEGKTSKLDRYNALAKSEDGAELQEMYLNAQESLPHDVAAIYQGLNNEEITTKDENGNDVDSGETQKTLFLKQISDFGLKQMVSGFQGTVEEQNGALVDLYKNLSPEKQKMLLTSFHAQEGKYLGRQFGRFKKGEPVLSTAQLTANFLKLYNNCHSDELGAALLGRLQPKQIQALIYQDSTKLTQIVQQLNPKQWQSVFAQLEHEPSLQRKFIDAAKNVAKNQQSWINPVEKYVKQLQQNVNKSVSESDTDYSDVDGSDMEEEVARTEDDDASDDGIDLDDLEAADLPPSSSTYSL